METPAEVRRLKALQAREVTVGKPVPQSNDHDGGGDGVQGLGIRAGSDVSLIRIGLTKPLVGFTRKSVV